MLESKTSSQFQEPRRVESTRSLHDAMSQAQQLAFAPVNFMSAYLLKKMGLLDTLHASLGEGCSIEELADDCQLTAYAVTVLIESALAIKAVQLKGERYHLTKLGHVLHRDEMTAVNFEFIYQVCYRGLFFLEESLRAGRPAGLPTISDAATVYEGLHRLAPAVKEAWLDFDHFYSDSAFAAALPVIFEKETPSILDVGGNTGRFAASCVAFNPDVKVTICDLPQQIEMASSRLADAEGQERISFHPCDLLQPEATLPSGFAVVWMSQFLVCFDEATVLRILCRARDALLLGGRMMILDTFWDRQKDPVSAFCLVQTSPYFSTIANGNSRIYRSDAIAALAKQAGLRVENLIDGLGISHSLMILIRE